MKLTIESVILITALFAGALVNGEKTPDPSKARLVIACSKAFIWAGSIDKSQPIIRELIDAYHNSDDDDKKAIEDYKKILDKYKKQIGDSGKNMYKCMNDLAITGRFDVQDFGECRKIFTNEDITKLLTPIVLKDLKTSSEIKYDIKNAIIAKYKCNDPENKHKPECGLPEKYETCRKNIVAA
uniref:Uncharacterized protein LOC114328974 n=1 Tax=Diabrotica virgifera virgifera TaxID=50390 RepID=A0A6P7FCR3_DIAVI